MTYPCPFDSLLDSHPEIHRTYKGSFCVHDLSTCNSWLLESAQDARNIEGCMLVAAASAMLMRHLVCSPAGADQDADGREGTQARGLVRFARLLL